MVVMVIFPSINENCAAKREIIVGLQFILCCFYIYTEDMIWCVVILTHGKNYINCYYFLINFPLFFCPERTELWTFQVFVIFISDENGMLRMYCVWVTFLPSQWEKSTILTVIIRFFLLFAAVFEALSYQPAILLWHIAMYFFFSVIYL
jgi:hypothetical protein